MHKYKYSIITSVKLAGHICLAFHFLGYILIFAGGDGGAPAYKSFT